MNRGLGLSSVVAAMLVASACSGSEGESESRYLIEQRPDIGVLDAPLHAVVSIIDDCPLISDTFGSDDPAERLQRAAWPNGTRFDPERDVITLPDGREIRDRMSMSGGGGSETFGKDLGSYDDVFEAASITTFSTTCREGELGSTELYLIAPDSIDVESAS